GSNLSGANLLCAEMDGASLSGVNLDRACLVGTCVPEE
ncbi:MAG: pentapeptide repeat-containing protein, partial [Moorea sp. SIO3I7]|nr:pentapeptide repeat-containing protein [Moorena sp. SIO3I7]